MDSDLEHGVRAGRKVAVRLLHVLHQLQNVGRRRDLHLEQPLHGRRAGVAAAALRRDRQRNVRAIWICYLTQEIGDCVSAHLEPRHADVRRRRVQRVARDEVENVLRRERRDAANELLHHRIIL